MGRHHKKKSAKEIIKIVTEIRRKNNILWMSLLALALATKPHKAKAIVRKITENDEAVRKWMAQV